MAKGFGSKGGMKSVSKGGGSSRSFASRSSSGGSRNRSSGARFSFGGGSGRSWFSAPGSPGHTGGSGRRSIWDDAGPEPAREQGSGALLDLAGLADGVEEAASAYREEDWGRFWRVVGLAALAIFVIVVMLSA